jgi:hypothetical protein
VIGVVAHLRGQVERHGKAGLPLLQQEAEALVRFAALPKPAYWRIVQSRLRYMPGARRG